MDDTIAAISTPIGTAGIGIIRISGEEALKIAEKFFRPKAKKRIRDVLSHTIVYGHVIDNEKEEVIDEALLTVMLAPKSFTTEDIVEVNCHGGAVAVRKTLEVVIKAGARLAEPGEFSKRAFLNGRIDLAQAESIMDLINAKTAASMKVAMGQLEGRLSQQISEIRNELLAIIAHIEAGIDFPEHDIEELSRQEIQAKTQKAKRKIDYILRSADTGKVFREGLNTVIVGKPNVGKSSLLNALVKEKRAIVTEIPGTTRDVIEEIVSIRGIPLKILDTAGIRDTEDIVEKIGVERSRAALKQADLYIMVVDAADGVTEQDIKIANILKEQKGILIVNKIDLKKDIETDFANKLGITGPVIYTSLLQGQGLDELEEKIVEFVYSNEFNSAGEVFVSNVRHQDALNKTLHHLEEVLDTLVKGLPTDCMAIDLNAAWEQLGKITGDTLGEDIINQIFSQFCIGK